MLTRMRAAITFSRVTLALLLITLSGITACDDEPPSTIPETPPATESTPPTAIRPSPPPAPTIANATEVVFYWIDEAPALFEGQEAPRTYQHLAPEGIVAEWSLYLVEDDGAPQHLYTTGRWLNSEPVWTPDDRIVLTFWAYQDPSFIHGAKSGPASAAFASGPEVLSAPGGHVVVSPQGALFLITGANGAPLFRQLDGRWQRLNSTEGAQNFTGWSPDSSHFLLRSAIMRPPVGYVVPSGGGRGYRLPVPLVGEQAWRPDGKRLALVSGEQVYLYEPGGKIEWLTDIPGNYAMHLHWSADGRVLAFQGDAIEVASRRRTSSGVQPQLIDGTSLSPNGRYLLVSENPHQSCSRMSDSSLSNKTHVLDTTTGASRPILDCDDGFHMAVSWYRDSIWLANGNAILHSFNCWSCEGHVTRVSILNVASGSLQTLRDGRISGRAYISPAGDRVLVTGDTLQIYSQDGTLLREITPPAGTEVKVATWAPDGRRFAYIIGPKGFQPGI